MAKHFILNYVIYYFCIVTVFVAIPGDQCLGTIMVTVDGKQRNILSGEPLPLSPKSTLTWMGSVISSFILQTFKIFNQWQRKVNYLVHRPAHTSNFRTAQDQIGYCHHFVLVISVHLLLKLFGQMEANFAGMFLRSTFSEFIM